MSKLSEKNPWWFPVLSEDVNNEYDEDEKKYSVTWDHLGDAYEEYEALADAYLELLKKTESK